MRTDVVLAADVGGSSTRVAVCGLDGSVLARVRTSGGNPNAIGVQAAARLIRDALLEALRDEPRTPGAVVIGLAGGSRVATEPQFLEAITPTGAPLARIVSDLAIAFSSATPHTDGLVLVAGTGAVAGRVAAGELVEQRDGWGWLLGDEGAGFWIGRELVRATLHALGRRQEPGSIERAVLEAAEASDRVGLVQACYARPPIWLASLAHLVPDHADHPVVRRIADRAADHLASLLLDLAAAPGQLIVLAGSVATAAGPVSAALRQRLAAAVGGELLDARSGLVGAAWTALRDLGVDDPAVHRRLVEGLSRY